MNFAPHTVSVCWKASFFSFLFAGQVRHSLNQEIKEGWGGHENAQVEDDSEEDAELDNMLLKI